MTEDHDAGASGGRLARVLDGIERVGNRLPDPALLFFLLLLLFARLLGSPRLSVISFLRWRLGWAPLPDCLPGYYGADPDHVLRRRSLPNRRDRAAPGRSHTECDTEDLAGRRTYLAGT